MFDTTKTHQILSDFTRLGEQEGVQIQVLKMSYDKSKWGVFIEKKHDGVELKVHHLSNDLMESLFEALLKWQRITGGIQEFRGQLIESTAQRLDDDIPF